jgi:hypothetical protein
VALGAEQLLEAVIEHFLAGGSFAMCLLPGRRDVEANAAPRAEAPLYVRQLLQPRDRVADRSLTSLIIRRGDLAVTLVGDAPARLPASRPGRLAGSS